MTVNQKPAITSPVTTTFKTGTAGTFTTTSTGFPAATYTETGSLPSGVTLSSGGVLSGTPAAGTGGSYPITITATNAAGSATQSFTLVVNQPAVFTSAATTTFVVGQLRTFNPTASGFPAPTFTESGTLPSGVTFDPTTGTLSGTPAAGTGKNYAVTLTATSAGGNASQTLSRAIA